MSRTLLNWGIFLVVLGAIPLGVMWGAIDVGATQQLLRLWPLILVGIGVGLLLRLTPAAPLGGVIAAATAGMLGGALLAGGFGGISGTCTSGQPIGELVTRSGDLSGATATAELELTCVGLTVDRQPGTTWSVEARHASGSAPVIESGPDSLTLRSVQGAVFLPFGGDTRRDWRVTLPQQTELAVGVTLNASTGMMDLSGGEIASMSGTFNASDVVVDMSGPGTATRSVSLTLNASSGAVLLPSTSLAGDLTLNASSLDLCVAPDVGLRIDYDDTFSSHNFAAADLRQVGDSWQDDAYPSAAQRIDLRVSANVSSITLSRTGGCP